MAIGWRYVTLMVALFMLTGCKSLFKPGQYQALETQHQQLQMQLAGLSEKLDQLDQNVQEMRNSYARSAGMMGGYAAGSRSTTLITPYSSKVTPLGTASISPRGRQSLMAITPVAVQPRLANISAVAPRATTAIRLPGDILFPSGKVMLTTSARQMLDRMADVILMDYANATVQVNGYSDKDPIRKSDWSNNDDLSTKRAQSVKDYLIARGISTSQVQAMGNGAQNQRATKALSRRVEVSVVVR